MEQVTTIRKGGDPMINKMNAGYLKSEPCGRVRLRKSKKQRIEDLLRAIERVKREAA